MNHINVNLDINTLLSPHLSGIGVYTLNLLNALNTRSDINLMPVFKYTRFRHRPHFALHSNLPAKIYMPFVTPMSSQKNDIFHGPDFKIYSSDKFKRVLTVHDLAFYEEEILNDRFAKKGREKLEFVLNRTRPDRIITVSNFIKEQILDRFPTYSGRVHTVYHGHDHLNSNNEATSIIHKKNYLLFVGNVEKRKNILRAIQAYERVKNRFDNLKLYIIGKNGNEAEKVDEYISISKLEHDVIRLGHVSSSELRSLYKNAKLLIYPSLYEGFGIPIIEAFSSGCPVITSNSGAMKEIAGDAAALVDQFDIDDIAEKILHILANNNFRQRLIDRGLNRSKMFTWNNCANNTVTVYKS